MENPFQNNIEYASNDLYIATSQSEKTNDLSASKSEFTEISQPQKVDKFMCIICNKPTLLCCNDCKIIFYCGLYHQKLHWKVHQNECYRENIESHGQKSLVQDFQTTIRSQDLEQLPVYDDQTLLSDSKEYLKLLARNEESQRLNFTHETGGTDNKSEKADDIEILLEERRRLLKEIFIAYSQGHINQSILKSKKLVKLSCEIFELTEKLYVYEHIADYLLHAKCLIKDDKFQHARENLIMSSKMAIDHISNSRIDYIRGRDGRAAQFNYNNLQKDFINFLQDDAITLKKKNEIVNQIKKITNLYSTIANLFYSVGDFNNCEQFYVKYVKIIENNYGGDSFESSNAYFLVGVFYLQHVNIFKENFHHFYSRNII